MRTDGQGIVPPQFLCDYGGIEHETCIVHTDQSRIKWLLKRYYQAEITTPSTQYTYDIQGITVILYSFGVHRCAYFIRPSSATADQLTRYENAFTMAQSFQAYDYSALKNNCVTATAKTLHCLNPNVDEKAWFPFFQFSGLEKHKGITQIVHDEALDPTFFDNDAQKAIARVFLTTYRNTTKKWQRTYWSQDHPATSLAVIYEHALGLYSGSGERTEACLLSLNWVKKDPITGLLLATETTPPVFANAIESSTPLAMIRCLSKWYKSHGGGFKSHIVFFNQRIDLISTLKRLATRAKEHPTGASHATLMQLASHIQATDRNPTQVFFSPELTPDNIIEAILSKNKKLICITPLQFIEMVLSGKRNFSQVHFQTGAREHISNDPVLQNALHTLSLSKLLLSGHIAMALLGYVSLIDTKIIDGHFSSETVDEYDFSSTGFENMIFENMTFSNTCFSHAHFSNCHFFNCSFTDVTFEKATMRRCKFVECDIQKTNLNCLFSFETNEDRKIHFLTCKLNKVSFTQNDSHDFQFTLCALSDVTMTAFYLRPNSDTFSQCTFSNIKAATIKLIVNAEELFFPINPELLKEFSDIAKEMKEAKKAKCGKPIETQASFSEYVCAFFVRVNPTAALSDLPGYSETKTCFDQFLCALYSDGELREKLVQHLEVVGARLLSERHNAQHTMQPMITA